MEKKVKKKRKTPLKKKEIVRKPVVSVSATPRAFEKIREIFNGSREKFFKFIQCITIEEVKEKKFTQFISSNKEIFYYEKCKNVYVIFRIEGEDAIRIVDILTEIEFREIYPVFL